MAELATIARPYAEALFAAGAKDKAFDPASAVDWLGELAVVAASPDIQQLAGDPLIAADQLFDLMAGLLRSKLPEAGARFLRMLIENRRLAVLPEISRQFGALLNRSQGLSLATVYSAFPMDQGALDALKAALDRRFGRALNLSVQVDESLIGGVRVVVGDEVLDLSVRNSLEQMKAALVA